MRVLLVCGLVLCVLPSCRLFSDRAACEPDNPATCQEGTVCAPSGVCVVADDATLCGNGTVDPGEACDFAVVSGPACTPNCTRPVCGNRILEPGEDCDDGDNDNGDGCSAGCRGEGDGGEGEGERDAGCHDGSAEGFATTLPGIRACGGTWSVPGLHEPRSTPNSAASLCAEGWHICASADEVGSELDGGSCDVDTGGFYAAAQSREAGNQSGNCGFGGNDVFGCVGPDGQRFQNRVCAPFNSYIGGSSSAACGPLSCPTSLGVDEALTVTNNDPSNGVLCCIDDLEGCSQFDTWRVEAQTDTSVGHLDPTGRGTSDELVLIAGEPSQILLGFTNVGAFDANVVSAHLELTRITGNGSVRLLRLSTDDWDELEATSAQPRSGGAWPDNSIGGLLVSETPTAPLTRIAVPLDVLRSAGAANADRISFMVEGDADVTFASREAETTTARPQLVVERCLNR